MFVESLSIALTRYRRIDVDVLSGLHVSNHGSVGEGISAAGQPDQAALAVFADRGYAAVIDLRAEHEPRGLDEKTAVEDLGMDYVLMPIVDTAAINFENARRLDELLGKYDEPVLIHCGSSNRVGALLALRESLNGADDASALQAGKDGGLTGLEMRVIEVLGEN